MHDYIPGDEASKMQWLGRFAVWVGTNGTSKGFTSAEVSNFIALASQAPVEVAHCITAHNAARAATATKKDAINRAIRQARIMAQRLQIYPTMTDTDRVSEGLFNVPGRLLEVRDLKLQGRQGDSLVRVSPGQIRRLDLTADVVQYAQNGDGTIEFRGNPAATDVFEILYYGTPAPFADDADENTLLTDHESLYMAGGKFWLYNHTQDRELMGDELEAFNGIVGDLNEQMARRIGGAVIAPTYNFAGGSSY